MQIKGIPSGRGTNKSAVEKPRIRFERLFASPLSCSPPSISCPKWGFQHKRNANDDNSYNIIRLMAVTFIVKYRGRLPQHPSPLPLALLRHHNHHPLGAHLRASLISVKCFLLFTFFGFATKQTTRPNCRWSRKGVRQRRCWGIGRQVGSLYFSISNCFGYGVDFYLCAPVTWPVSVINK